MGNMKQEEYPKNYLRNLPAEEANDLAEQLAEAIAEGATTKVAAAIKYNCSVRTLNKFLTGELNPEGSQRTTGHYSKVRAKIRKYTH